MVQFITAKQAASLLHDGDVVAMSGYGKFGTADAILQAIQERYECRHEPKRMTLVKVASAGDGQMRGGNRLAAPGLLEKVITSHIGFEPKLAETISKNQCLAYLLPAGTILRLYRSQTLGEKGFLTTVGLNTTVDPRQEGGCGNERTEQQGNNLASVVSIAGKEYLYYATFPIQIGIIRGSIADEKGNVSLVHEQMIGEQLEIAMAVKQSGGVVMVQVEEVVRQGTLEARQVAIPSHLVDYITVVKDSADEACVERKRTAEKVSIMPMTARKICARRAVMEIKSNQFVNLGIGMPESLASIMEEEGLTKQCILAADSGVIGGTQQSGIAMGSAIHPESVMPMVDMMALCNGGGLDVCVLGLAETDRDGNINVSRFNGRMVGPGGFIDLTMQTKNLIFLGTFTASGLAIQCHDGKLSIVQEGVYNKFKTKVEQVTFSGKRARDRRQKVLCITERAVFALADNGWRLDEIAPGIDVRKHILPFIDFPIAINPDLKEMDARIFAEGKMGFVLGRHKES